MHQIIFTVTPSSLSMSATSANFILAQSGWCPPKVSPIESWEYLKSFIFLTESNGMSRFYLLLSIYLFMASLRGLFLYISQIVWSFIIVIYIRLQVFFLLKRNGIILESREISFQMKSKISFWRIIYKFLDFKMFFSGLE